MPAVPGRTGRDGSFRRCVWGRKIWGGVGRVCRSDGARSLLGVLCYNQVVPTELRERGPYHGGATRRYAGKMPAVPGWTGGDWNSRKGCAGTEETGGAGRVCRSDGARSLLGVRCYNQVVPTELRERGAVTRRGYKKVCRQDAGGPKADGK